MKDIMSQSEAKMKDWLESGKVEGILALREVNGNVMPHLFSKGDEMPLPINFVLFA